jgi:hypothetical protein
LLLYEGASTADNGPQHATWEHRNPGVASGVVLVAWLVNNIKTDLREREFKAMVKTFAAFWDDESKPFDQAALPRKWRRGPRPPVPREGDVLPSFPTGRENA